MYEWRVSFGHTQKWSTRKAQTPPANTGSGGSWVRGKRAWSGGGERGKLILGFLFRLFWGKYPVRMTCHPKEVRIDKPVVVGKDT